MLTTIQQNHLRLKPGPKLPAAAAAPTPPQPRPTTVKASAPSANNPQDQSSTTAGRIKRLVLNSQGRAKLDASPDRDFYSFPRFVTHVDAGFIGALTGLYRERLRGGWEVLDLMSSWVSHLPEEVEFGRVVGHGMNAQELARNPRLDYFFVKDLNRDQQFQLEGGSFDAVLCTVSVQYLQWPEKVFHEVFTVLKPGGAFVVSFSNRMFYEKAVAAWRDGSPYSRTQLVVEYFQCVEGFTQPEVIKRIPERDGGGSTPFGGVLRLLGLSGSDDPFYAVIAYKNFKPI